MRLQFLPEGDARHPVSSLADGHIILEGDFGSCSSQLRGRPVARLVWNVIDLIRGLHAFLHAPTAKEYGFGADGGHYSLRFIKNRSKGIDIYCGGVITRKARVAQVSVQELVAALSDALQELESRYGPATPSSGNDHTGGDLEAAEPWESAIELDARQEFRVVLELWQGMKHG